MATNNFNNQSTRNGFNKSVAAVINAFQTRMGKMARVATLMAMIGLISAAPATAQVKFGIKGGITTTELKDKNSILDSQHHTAYNAGLMLDLNIPKVNLGLEVSAMYRFSKNDKIKKTDLASKRHCIDIPVYARYRLAIPSVEKIVAPIIFTGPNISVILSDNKLKEIDERKTRLSWDVGAGVDLFKHVRLTASYGIGMNKVKELVGKEHNDKPVEGKDQCWTLSAAIMF